MTTSTQQSTRPSYDAFLKPVRGAEYDWTRTDRFLVSLRPGVPRLLFFDLVTPEKMAVDSPSEQQNARQALVKRAREKHGFLVATRSINDQAWICRMKDGDVPPAARRGRLGGRPSNGNGSH